MSATYLRIFFRKEALKFAVFSSVVFQAELLRSTLRIKRKCSRGVRGMLPREIFENLHTVVAILALFEQFLGKFCLNCLPLNLSVSPNMMHFVRTFSTMRA